MRWMRGFVRARAFPALPLALAVLASAAPAEGQAGALELLRVEIGARAKAMGGAATAALDPAVGLPANPASAAFAARPTVAASYARIRDLLHQDLLSAVLPTGGGALGVSLYVQRFAAIPATDRDGGEIGRIEPQVALAGLTYARAFGPALGAGATLKAFRSDLLGGASGAAFDAAATGVGLDLGVAYQPVGLPVSLGAALLDVGPGVRLRGERDALPTRLRTGVALRPLDLMRRRGEEGAAQPVGLLLGLEGDFALAGGDADPALHYGVEVGVAGAVSLRAGLPALDAAGERPLWLGLGVAAGPLRADVARRFSSHPALGEELHATLAFTF